MVDSAEEAAGLVHHRYTNDSGGLREIARRSAVVDVDNQGEITKVGAGLRPHNGRDGAARSMPVDLPLATSAPTVAMRPPDILPATVTDADDIVRALLAGAGIAYKDLPGAETGGVERLVADMALRWRPRYRERLADGSPGIFVARQDGEFAGFIWASHRSDELIAWHVLPEFHGHKIGSHLMRTALSSSWVTSTPTPAQPRAPWPRRRIGASVSRKTRVCRKTTSRGRRRKRWWRRA